MVVKMSQKFRKRILTSSLVRAGTPIWKGDDMISSLPDHLLYHILSFLTTEQAVWMSVLSSRWRSLWKWVPRLHLNTSYFPNDKTCADFINKFLTFQSQSYLRDFKLSIDQDNFDSDVSLYEPYLAVVINKRNIQHFQVETRLETWNIDEIPLTLSVCEALVCLKLHFVRLNDFESLSLPCLKIMYLEDILFPSDAAAETLISCSPVLEDLKISLSTYNLVVVLRVSSQSLKSFTLKRAEPVYAENGAHAVVVDTPRLEYLNLIDFQFKRIKIIRMSDSVKVDLDFDLELTMDELREEKTIIYSILNNFSGVGAMTISWRTLKLLYHFQYLYPLPKFHDLTRLRVTMSSHFSPEVLPIVLESFPNLKHFTLELVDDYSVTVMDSLSNVRSHCLVSSLETVEMESPITEKAIELKLVRYFLENAATLKKLVLHLDKSNGKKHEPGVLKQLSKSPRRSSLCEFEVLTMPENPEPWWIPVKTNRF